MPAVTDPPIAFTEVEQKLLRLLLCPSAQRGEIDGAGRALIASWRKRGLLAETLLNGNSVEQPTIEYPRRPNFDPGDFVMPFGRYRGIALHRIRPRYLTWVLANCHDIQPELKRAIRAVLYGN